MMIPKVLTGRRAQWALVACALVAYAALAITGAKQKSNAFDEIAHLTAGYSYWTLGDYRLQPENGNWPQRLVALPAVLRGATFASLETDAWRGSDVWTVGDEFFFDRGNDIDRLLLEGRALVTLLGMGLGALVFVWAKRLTGTGGAWLALLLFVASPTMLAHGALTTSDMAAALGFMAAVGALWRVLHRVTPATVLMSVLATSALLLAKYSGVLLAPIGIILVAIRLFLQRPLIWRRRRSDPWRMEYGTSRQVAVIAGLVGLHVMAAVLLIWASYGFRYSAFAGASAGQHFYVDWPRVLGLGPEGGGLTAGAVQWARSWHLLPEAYLYGFSHTMTFSQTRMSFLNGVVSNTGRAAFFPYAFMTKSTLPFIIFCLGGLAVWLRGPVFPRQRYQLIPLVTLLVVYGGAALTSNLNIGHRHLLPIYPVLMIMAGVSAWWATRSSALNGIQRNIAVAVVVALAAWHVGESAMIRPNYLTYFNQLDGGPAQGYRHLVESSLDWGQDLPALKIWLDEHRQSPDEPVFLSYFGTSRPLHFGIDVNLLPSFINRRHGKVGAPWTPGLYVFGATMLAGVYSPTQGQWTPAMEAQYQQVRRMTPEALAATGDLLEQLQFGRLSDFLRRREPSAQVANSMLVYRLSDGDLDEALDR